LRWVDDRGEMLDAKHAQVADGERTALCNDKAVLKRRSVLLEQGTGTGAETQVDFTFFGIIK